MTTTHTPSVKAFLITVLYGLTMSLSTMALCVAVIMLIPATGPGVWFAVPLALFGGMAVIHSRMPGYSYPIGVIFVPIVGAILILAAIQVSWTVLGNYL
jgi:hypothetical protein